MNLLDLEEESNVKVICNMRLALENIFGMNSVMIGRLFYRSFFYWSDCLVLGR